MMEKDHAVWCPHKSCDFMKRINTYPYGHDPACSFCALCLETIDFSFSAPDLNHPRTARIKHRLDITPPKRVSRKRGRPNREGRPRNLGDFNHPVSLFETTDQVLLFPFAPADRLIGACPNCNAENSVVAYWPPTNKICPKCGQEGLSLGILYIECVK
ncbi:hypothetical protein [Acanthopleuribacter pedis]|uniref:Uncharacterized protein n=1 Tax=Acanthopleuribacter pedis TaxID=442870 RepID=A0A8J7Q7Q9_9BACT|nr:hypothetical protein [Acanthopleuribacter pedis]MBO1319921.1 hypothetical protein [Acanthopleuribacter pedis]